MSTVRLAKIETYTIVDGPGLRTSVYFQGCKLGCPGCHNPETHDPNGGYLEEVQVIVDKIVNTKYIRGVTISGGDPLFQADGVLELCKSLKSVKPELDIVLYSGLQFNEISEKFSELMRYVDFVVDGRFVKSLKTYDGYFSGSSNQKFVDVKNNLVIVG